MYSIDQFYIFSHFGLRYWSFYELMVAKQRESDGLIFHLDYRTGQILLVIRSVRETDNSMGVRKYYVCNEIYYFLETRDIGGRCTFL
jgi:hypothetical protein